MIEFLRQSAWYVAGALVIMAGAATLGAYLLGEWIFKLFGEEGDQ